MSIQLKDKIKVVDYLADKYDLSLKDSKLMFNKMSIKDRKELVTKLKRDLKCVTTEFCTTN